MMSPSLESFAGSHARLLSNRNAWRAAKGEVAFERMLTPAATAAAKNSISTWPGYAESSLVSLPGLAEAVGLGEIRYKDEAGRFGLGSFKALGGAYAVSRLLGKSLNEDHGVVIDGVDALIEGRHRAQTEGITVASATDGNHGRSVAWGARQFGCKCVIYIHAEVSQGREEALRVQGAEVVRVPGNYDQSVRRCAEDAEREGWIVVSDTSWEGYHEIPLDVMAGYSVLVSEMIAQLQQQAPSHVFVQGGVGGIAGTVADLFAQTWGAARPRFIVVEPALAPCLYASATAGRPTVVDVQEETLMAGLSCGEVSALAWRLLSGAADDFMTIGEAVVAPAMRLLAEAPYGDEPLVAGESAVAGLAAVLTATQSPMLRECLGLDEQSRVLVIGTEGATDRAIYAQLTGRAPETVTTSPSLQKAV